MIPRATLLLAGTIVAIVRCAAVAEASASLNEPAAMETTSSPHPVEPDLAEAKDVRAVMDLKQQENAEKADIKSLEKMHEISQKSHEKSQKSHKKEIALRKAVTQSTLDKIQLAEETARSHEAPGAEEDAEKSPAGEEDVLLETKAGLNDLPRLHDLAEAAAETMRERDREKARYDGFWTGTWTQKDSGKCCRGATTPEAPASAGYTQDGGGACSGEWEVSSDPPQTFAACKAACDDLYDSWGCKYISWSEQYKYCYVHQDCTNLDANSAYTAYEAATCEHHTGITGPEFPGLKLPNGTTASSTWYAPYQEHELASHLKALGCNLASCDNPSGCGIPVCRGISDRGHTDAYTKGVTRSRCDGAGCDIEQYAQVVASTFPDQSNVQGTIDGVSRNYKSSPMTATEGFPGYFLPGIRFGIYQPPGYTPGFITALPAGTDHTATGTYDGSWLLPDRRHCNPLEWLAISKLAIARTPRAGDLRSGVLLTKLTVCLKANCAADDAACAPQKCYATKKGKCITFNEDVFPQYQSQADTTHSDAAYELLEAGSYTDCDETAEAWSQPVIAGN